MARLTSSGAPPTRLALGTASLNVVLFAFVSLAGWASWSGLAHAVSVHGNGTLGGVLAVVGEGAAIVLVDVVYGAGVIAVTFALRPFAHGWVWRALVVVGAAIVLAPLRALALVALDTTPTGTLYAVAEWALGAAAGAVAVLAGLLLAELVDRARVEALRRAGEQQRAARAVQELQAEELRVRRMVADQLHGTLQFRLVTVTAALDAMSRELAQRGDDAHAARAREVADTLDRVREDEVRALSHAVFPSGVDLGVVPAVQVVLRRLPPTVDATLELGDRYHAAQDDASLPVAERLVVIYVIEEALLNALKHGKARTIRVRVDVAPGTEPGRWVFEATVDDDGSGLARPDPALHGLARHRDRVEQRGGTLELAPNPAGAGARLRLTLPFAASTRDVEDA